jgi:hypothetical protein
MAGRTRAIVRLDGANRMVTKGYQKGVYERVTKGISGGAWVRGQIRFSIRFYQEKTSQVAGQGVKLGGLELRERLRGCRPQLLVSLEAINVAGCTQAGKVGCWDNAGAIQRKR